MLRRGLYRSLWIAIVAAGVLLVPPAAALADSAPPASVQSNFGHPELSTTSELMVSYFDPAQGPAGHVVANAFAW